MADFEDFLHDLEKLVQEYAKDNLALKIEKDQEDSIVRVFGEKTTSLTRAKTGLDDVLELSQTTAEHHPFWSLLDNSAEITATVLEKWQDKMSDLEIDEIKWHIRELSRSVERLGKKYPSG